MTRPVRPPSAETLARESHVLELRRAGVTFPRIAAELGLYDKSEAHKIFKRAMARVHAEPAAEIRELEADRLDRLMVKVWTKALAGDLHAVDRVLAIMQRRAKLLGLDHEHGIAERALQLEAARVRMVAVALGRALDVLNLTEEQRSRATGVLLAELRAADADADDDDEHDVIEGKVVDP